MEDYLVPLTVYLHTKLGTCTGISFIDSTALAVCKNPRISSHRVFDGLAKRGKTSTAWFFRFKLHLVVNDHGELLAFCLTPGNMTDRSPVPKLAKKLFGKLMGDKGYLSQAFFEQLFSEQHLQLITRLRANMKNRLMPSWISCFFGNERSLRPSMINSRVSARLNILVIAAPPTFWSISFVGLLPIVGNPKSLPFVLIPA
jgi:Transposase DDE domain